MVRKIIQWVPIEGTRWRNEVANDQENHAVSFHYEASETPIADTFKTEPTLIEEGAPMPESLRFGSEPWTFFYMAGGIIRESRNLFRS